MGCNFIRVYGKEIMINAVNLIGAKSVWKAGSGLDCRLDACDISMKLRVSVLEGVILKDGEHYKKSAYQLSSFWAYILSAVPMHSSRLSDNMTVWLWYFSWFKPSIVTLFFFSLAECFKGGFWMCNWGVFERSANIGHWLDTKQTRNLVTVYLG